QQIKRERQASLNQINDSNNEAIQFQSARSAEEVDAAKRNLDEAKQRLQDARQQAADIAAKAKDGDIANGKVSAVVPAMQDAQATVEQRKSMGTFDATFARQMFGAASDDELATLKKIEKNTRNKEREGIPIN